MDGDEARTPFRTAEDARRLQAMGLHLAMQVITPAARRRERRAGSFRDELAPIREFLRPHVFRNLAAREAACARSPAGGVIALEPVDADDLGGLRDDLCAFGIGHGVDEPAFDDVATIIVDPEMASLVEHRAARAASGAASRSDAIVLSVSGALYQCHVDEEGTAQVRAKAPFGMVPDDEVARTAAWLLVRLRAWTLPAVLH